MRTVFLGAGAVGGFLGGLLTDSGEDVTLVEIRKDYADLLQREGLKISFPSGEQKLIKVRVTSDINSVDKADFIFVAVKSCDTRSTVEGAKVLMTDETWVMSVQNGAGNIETIASVLGSEDHTIGGVFLSSVTPIGPNHLRYTYVIGGLKIGTMSGKAAPQLEQIAQMFRRAGIEVEITVKVQDMIWQKVLQNSVNPIAAITGLYMDDFMDYPTILDLVEKTASEVAAVVKAKGLALQDPEHPTRPLFTALENFRAARGKSKASMLQDIEARRRTEIDAINGAVVKEGKSLGIPTPFNEALVLLLKAIEEKSRLIQKTGRS